MKKRMLGYPTPDTIPEESHCRRLRIPNDEQWLSVVMGALYALTLPENWQKVGDLTPDEAAEEAYGIFSAAYESAQNVCANYVLPSGSRIIRINASTGHLEEESDDAAWVAPTGDYVVPPIAPRESGTDEDKRCLAAANAAHVLELLYESITDSIAHELEVAEALTAMIEAFITAVGWEFAPIAFAIAAFFLVVFGVIYAVVKLIGSDVWDDTFTDVLRCALYNCTSVDEAGVVTFDWVCVQDNLSKSYDALSFDQFRLYSQLIFIVQSIGGVDGLNQAGATTAITTANCDDCGECVPASLAIIEVSSFPLGANLSLTGDQQWNADAVYYEPGDVWYLALCSSETGVGFTVSSWDYTSGAGVFENDSGQTGASDCTADMPDDFQLDTDIQRAQWISHEPFSIVLFACRS